MIEQEAILIGVLIIIAIAAKDIGKYLARYGLPLISGFLLVGLMAGPFILHIVTNTQDILFPILDALALAFIAFAAGGELDFNEVRDKLRGIGIIIATQTILIFILAIGLFFAVQPRIAFMAGMSTPIILSVAMLAGTIMIARSPSSAYAIIKELRAKGPFTQLVLGVTVISDAFVILVFATTISIAEVLVQGAEFNAGVIIFLAFEITFDIGLGLLVGQILRGIMAIRINDRVKGLVVIAVGGLVFWAADLLHGVHILPNFPVGLFSEPLLICMTAGFFVANFTRYKSEFHHIIETYAPVVLIVFFTLVGLTLEVDVLTKSWQVLLILVFVRLFGMLVGSFIGGELAGNPREHNLYSGMTFITQAGVSIGLAKEIGVAFEPWGIEFTTLMIGMIVFGQFIGPPMFKAAIQKIGEARTRAPSPEFDGVRDAVIFGMDNQSLTLARQVAAHNWNVKLVTSGELLPRERTQNGIKYSYFPNITLEILHTLKLQKVESVVLMLSDEENYEIAEMIYENFGTRRVIVRLESVEKMDKFRELGVMIVEPATSIVNLLDQYVRSNVATTLLLGMDHEQEVIDVIVQESRLNGMPLRDILLPEDVLILSIRRRNDTIVTHGYTRLALGDEVSVMGSPSSLEQVQLLFES